MTHPIPPVSRVRPSLPIRPEHNWISDGSTLNPSPGALLKRRRDTAAGCRDRATESLLHSATSAAVGDRTALVDNAARWTARAEQLQIVETDAEAARISGAAIDSPPLAPNAGSRREC